MSEPKQINPIDMTVKRNPRQDAPEGQRVLMPVIMDKHEEFMDVRPVFQEAPVAAPKGSSVPASANDSPPVTRAPEGDSTVLKSVDNIISPPAL